MQNKYPLWKYLLLLSIVILAFLYALPNLYSEDPAVQISRVSGHAMSEKVKKGVLLALLQTKIPVKAGDTGSGSDPGLVLRFASTDLQLKAQDVIKKELGNAYTVALNLVSSTPHWLTMLHAIPMKQGLDLRGGVHFLLEVDLNAVMSRRMDGMLKNIGQTLRELQIRYTGLSISSHSEIRIRFTTQALMAEALSALKHKIPELVFSKGHDHLWIHAILPQAEQNTIRQNTIEQTMSILRNRVNELGIGEALVQQQGATRVAVDLPGIQDAARAKQILGGTATLEFHLVDQEHDPFIAKKTGIVPQGSKLYQMEKEPILLKRPVVLSGDSITSALSSFDQQSASPSVDIQLGGGGEALFSRVTRANVGKRMAIVFVETKVREHSLSGVRSSYKEERVISAPVIQSALGRSFQITGLKDVVEARNLALLLRAGALPATIYPIEERTVGPTLGKENIHRGFVSLAVGMATILIIMLLYYRTFGLIADLALLLNLVLLVAVLSFMEATLTLPGIAGIVLTVGMAVDANVLIYERIREELRKGASPQAAIYTGYERAFSTIIDANVTTLIVAIVLCAIGTGTVKGFAVTLSMGILTSMLTGIAMTRAIVNLCYGGRVVKKLSIGI